MNYTDTDLCVKCGLCLPHCPTYTQTQDENESPRGRLALIQGYGRGALAATPKLIGHVDGCLLCRACESVCPAKVPYGRIVDRFRQEVGESAKPLATRMKTAGLRKLLTSSRASGLVGKAGGMMRGWFDGGPLGELSAGLPPPLRAESWFGEHPAQGREIARVQLFLGCTAQLLDTATVNATLRLLTRLGVRVRVPETQTCCGALHRHAGEEAAAGERMRQNLAAFGEGEEETIVSFASGCGSMLHEYSEAMPGSGEAVGFSKRVMDISAFLAKLAWPEDVKFHPLPATISLHAPCSLRHVLKAERPPAALLGKIPELRLIPLPATTQCCGAAGSHMLERPEMAGRLREETLDRILKADPGYLVTSNPGCAMHLRAGLRWRGRDDIEVLHPVALMEQQVE